VQLGGGDSRVRIQPLHILLNKIFNNSEIDYFETIENFSIYFRVCGKFNDFGDEGPNIIEYIQQKKLLCLDYIVPENTWQLNNNVELK